VSDDAAFMRRALELAHLGLGGSHPNPLVGAVVVREGVIVGEGWHERHGAAHGEVNALHRAGAAAVGATLYVTLEPCAHHGRTPPCTDAIIAAGIRRVVFAAEDPNPKAAGGAQLLRAAGIEVAGGVERSAARSVNALFFHTHEEDTPFVALKLAMSLDGGIAAAPGARTQLTGAEAQRVTHRLRAAHDAVLIGSGTARADDPLLTVRLFHGQRQPARIVLDSEGAISLNSKLVATARDGPLFVICGNDVAGERLQQLQNMGVRILAVPRGTGGVDLRSALRAVQAEGVQSILVEGGSAVANAFLAAGLVHRLSLFLAPRILGAGTLPAFTVPGTIDGWRCTRAQTVGDDAFLTFDPPERT
jgi:diaminohydroxyphosphoribosylaminopyrimidine deaminase / 5-amino-6-(5-phosphoribosylamino)uracil reductase